MPQRDERPDIEWDDSVPLAERPAAEPAARQALEEFRSRMVGLDIRIRVRKMGGKLRVDVI